VDPVRFYRYFALVPLFVPAVVWLLAWAFPELVPEPLRGVQFLIAMSVVALPIYVPFAVLIYWLLRHRPLRPHRTWSYWVPLPFALLVFAVWFLLFVPEFPLAERAQKSLGAAAFGAGLGYAYVLLMHATFAVGRRLGLIGSPKAAA
jgi:hypothetical protein